MLWNINMEVTEKGFTANGTLLNFAKTMWPKDRRYYGSHLGNGVKDFVYRRDLARRDLLESYGIELPRGANIGTKWVARIESPLFGVWAGTPICDVDQIEDFGEDDPDGYLIFLDNESDEGIEVTEEHRA